MSSCYTRDDFKKLFSDPPKALNDIYRSILLRLQPRNEVKALAALKWLSFSLRPLTLNELAEFMIVDPRPSSEFNLEDKRLSNPMWIQSILPGFVTVDHIGCSHAPSEDSPRSKRGDGPQTRVWDEHRQCTISLAHSSIREFLTGNDVEQRFAIHDSVAHTFELERCLFYTIHVSQLEGNETRKLQPFWALEYCCTYWPVLAQKVFSEGSDDLDLVHGLVHELIGKHRRAFTFYLKNEPSSRFDIFDTATASPAWVFAYYNLICPLLPRVKHARKFLGINEVYDGATSLHVAIGRGHLEAADMLVEHGADLDLRDDRDLTPLHLTVRLAGWRRKEAYQGFVQRLLKLKPPANPSMNNCLGKSVLQEAVDHGNEDIVRSIMDLSPCTGQEVPLSSEKFAVNMKVLNTSGNTLPQQDWMEIQKDWMELQKAIRIIWDPNMSGMDLATVRLIPFTDVKYSS